MLTQTIALTFATFVQLQTAPVTTQGVVPDVNPIVIQKIEPLKPIKRAKFKHLEFKHKVAVPKATASVQKSVSQNVSSGCGVYKSHGNPYMDFIFANESSNNPCNVNSIGCIGLGQSCPGGSGLATDCPNWRVDIECQIRHFTIYANKYGGWAGSYAFWVSHRWW